MCLTSLMTVGLNAVSRILEAVSAPNSSDYSLNKTWKEILQYFEQTYPSISVIWLVNFLPSTRIRIKQ